MRKMRRRSFGRKTRNSSFDLLSVINAKWIAWLEDII
jgi:hypothetical protein